MNFANINHCWGSLIIEELSRLGVDYFCVAPGSRSSPLVIPLAQKGLKSFVHFDERGLAFHAMGYIAATRKPAVIISTSGTAGANFYPAIIEASKKKLPLIVITADRPPELRQTGAVQTIDQVGLYGKYVCWAMDMPCPDTKISPEFVLTTVAQAWYQALRHHRPVHINCMFRQPLALTAGRENLKTYLKSLDRWAASQKPYTEYATGFGPAPLAVPKKIAARLQAIKNGVIVVGRLASAEEGGLVVALAEKLGWPVFADVSSGLRLGHARGCLIHYFDHLLSSDQLAGKLNFDGVLHLGGRMTSVRYYDFIQKRRPAEYIMVINHALRNDPNHQVTLRVESGVGHFIQTVIRFIKARKGSRALKILSKADEAADRSIEKSFVHDEALSEPRVARLVSQLVPAGQGLFLSNSMPIRDMANFADFKGNPVLVNANRGASGIDGIIASAAGYARGSGRPATLMIGDLAALHDLNSLGMLGALCVPLVIVVLNNAGGAIFSFLPIAGFKEGFEKFWAAPHSYTLEAAAQMFGLGYRRPMGAGQFKKDYARALGSRISTVIEVMTNREENLRIHKQLQETIHKVIS
ncbi:MAG: 2-succinyl-5-enolpyruvyl-6-hydroxy-3-cyclohexene-1-carboxylic-acid synthase [Candidatus Omnitrophica bacterium]|nr:2-succinyl-5-enolpyruvyl-6-hydroxy-3-cyclohexene-1-carboxylic-acid synthase [Candidatus Omnitrophota bacterium]MDE2009083.1 2-succinyl-5-enolpyruvyl-6-hydroxy-3-cyclohexene-1-carboxylic-acid synthase [Candidatus Omnitrophota bacterium]MDE2214252.1 2-succinyl-5-enolpyruvyl-6-hydroxy-3-cyclohexene-1-carboxylic-acid synthase [Candidatus Omnitrophota bacterium]MDE2231289.1 2-succinyl-5-enolpyruvyl-6-hydroxy-3-cyclohexene-1-carboxylic-acid synthase [Candidatus Omnitrophota bacterium]